jgi:hypothetical protein
MSCHREVCGCFAQHLAWVHVHLKLLPSNAWSCLGARGSTWRTWCRLPQECRSAGVAFLLSCRYVHKEHMVCIVGILAFTAMWVLKCVWKVESDVAGVEVLSPLAEAEEASTSPTPHGHPILLQRQDRCNQCIWSDDRVVYSTSQHYRSCEKRCLRYSRCSRSALPAF